MPNVIIIKIKTFWTLFTKKTNLFDNFDEKGKKISLKIY